MRCLDRCGPWLVFGAGLLLRLTPPWSVNHDCGWFLYVAERVLAGDALYRDIVEVNPPLIVYFSMLPAVVARVLSIGIVPAFHGCVLGLAALSLALTSRVLRPVLTGEQQSARRAWLAGLAFVLVVMSGNDFGQREHLMVLLVLPWFVLTAVRTVGQAPKLGLCLWIGGLAGLGLALKPYFLIAPLLARLVAGDRPFARRRPENEMLSLVLVLYAAHFLLVPYGADYLRVLELLRATYEGLETDLAVVLAQPWSRRWAWLLPILVVVAMVSSRWRRPLLVMIAGSLGFALAALWQRKGWSYHLLPALALEYTVLSFLVVGWWPSAWRGLVSVALVLTSLVPIGQHWLRYDPVTGEIGWEAEFTGIPTDLREVASLSPGAVVVVLDTDMPAFFAWLVDHRVGWGGRYALLFTLPVAVLDAALFDRLAAEIAADLERHRPELVAVRRGVPNFVPSAMGDFAAALRAHPAVSRALSAYHQVRVGSSFEIYRRRQ